MPEIERPSRGAKHPLRCTQGGAFVRHPTLWLACAKDWARMRQKWARMRQNWARMRQKWARMRQKWARMRQNAPHQRGYCACHNGFSSAAGACAPQRGAAGLRVFVGARLASSAPTQP